MLNVKVCTQRWEDLWLKVLLFLCICVCLSVGMCTMHTDACGGQKRELNPLELELLVAVSHLKQVLGIQLESSKRATIALRP